MDRKETVDYSIDLFKINIEVDYRKIGQIINYETKNDAGIEIGFKFYHFI